jgi:hypothetical protein
VGSLSLHGALQRWGPPSAPSASRAFFITSANFLAVIIQWSELSSVGLIIAGIAQQKGGGEGQKRPNLPEIRPIKLLALFLTYD